MSNPSERSLRFVNTDQRQDRLHQYWKTRNVSERLQAALSLHREGNALFKGENPNFIYTIEFKFIPELGASGNNHAED